MATLGWEAGLPESWALVDSPFTKYCVFSGYQDTFTFIEPLAQITELITLKRYIFRETYMQIIVRYLLYARWYVGTKDAEIDMPDTEQREKESASHSHKNEETEAHKRLGVRTKVTHVGRGRTSKWVKRIKGPRV